MELFDGLDHYETIGARALFSSLNVSTEVLHCMGQLLDAEGINPVVYSIQLGGYMPGGSLPFYDFDVPSFNLDVTMDPELETMDHSELLSILKEELWDNLGIQETVFSYCHHSYGVECEQLSIHFGFPIKK